jgi:hypothetical protein
LTIYLILVFDCVERVCVCNNVFSPNGSLCVRVPGRSSLGIDSFDL